MGEKWYNISEKQPILRHEREVDRTTGEVYEWDFSDPVLVIDENYGDRRYRIAYAARGTSTPELRFYDEGDCTTLGVRFWMPLPPMPELCTKVVEQDG